MKKFLTFLKKDYLIFLVKVLSLFIISYIFLLFSLNYLEKFLINLNINSFLNNYKEEILRFLSSEDVKQLIKNILNK